jgi:rhodanese-related sulfurtransferase
METSSRFEWQAMAQQGYDFNPDELRELSWGLRFTPLVCMGIALLGLFLRESFIHFSLAALGIIPFWFPRAHPVDLLYNKALRFLWNGIALPPNPLPRRIACFMGGMMNLAIGLFFLFNMWAWAYGFGLVLVCLQLVVIFTHFCLASWFFERGLKLVGAWGELISREEFENALTSKALLVDVRGPDEFAEGHLKDAVNIPLENLEDRLEDKARTYILYCQGGFRSQKGARKLKAQGFSSILNLGAMERAQSWMSE